MANALFIGKVYYRFDEIPSTNDYARELLTKSKPPEGTAIQAASQSAGRGQYGSRWLSTPGQNLLLSIILYPTWLAAANQFRLAEAVALAVSDTVSGQIQAAKPRDHGGRPQNVPQQTGMPTIKWPNDIYLGDRKTAGILIQNNVSGQFLQSSVVGIGLNANQTAFPPDVLKATSLALETGAMFDLEALAEALFVCLEQRYLQLKNGQTTALRAEYHQHLYGLGEVRTFARADGSRFTGAIQRVADDGRVLIHTNAGEEAFGLKEVVFEGF
ncbi:MAG: biotin--[acetyl-CoA-carboxylase] ligase [Saprospiraceae bacterium]